VEKSNHKALLDAMPSEYEDGFEYLDIGGGHGTFAIAIRLDALTADMLETLESLEDYPLIDESLHSELEIESQNEAWESSIRSEFRTELGKYLAASFEHSAKAESLTDATLESAIEWLEDGADISDSDLAELCWKMADFANEYWTNEQGSDSYLDVEDVVK